MSNEEIIINDNFKKYKSIKEKIVDWLTMSDETVSKYSYEAQCYYIYNLSEYYNSYEKSSIIVDMEKALDRSEHELSEKQKQIVKSINQYLKDEKIFDVYYKLIEFFGEDCGDKEKIYLVEYNQLKDTLEYLKQIIMEKIDIKAIYEEIISKINENSTMKICILTGKTTKESKDYRMLYVSDNFVIYNKGPACYDKNIEKEIIKNVKRIIVKYKREIFTYVRMQKENNILNKIKSSDVDFFLDDLDGTIDFIKVRLTNKVKDKELNDFFAKFKEEIFKILDSVQGEERDNDENYNKYSKVSRYNGTAGKISIRNINFR